ncbi:hypothetical protein EST38_g807 [Candolleomyces aberdarensis]|uniref:Uncharacterized protein n=1 Tax=Candolleomyces aberdarensis TaxID=2316362 RepID=A0A4Q2DZ47_9AGAR|nr:hypothetical protein EST38_g807 [Candolleomyces aberdarensis]
MMQNIIERVQGFLIPFRCQFTDLRPTQQGSSVEASQPIRELPPEIWLEIFEFATYVHRSATIKPLDPFTVKRTSTNVMGVNTPVFALQTKLAIIAVCKSWRRLALPILYRHIVIRSPKRAERILEALQASRTTDPVQSQATGPINCGQWTRHIEVFTHSRGCASLKYLQSLFAIFRCCPNLQILSGTWIHLLPPEFLDAVSRMYGPSVEGLYWSETSDRIIRRQDRPITTSTTLAFLSAFSLSTANRLSLPRLHSFTVKPSTPNETDHYQLVQLLQVHGHSLVSVDISLPSLGDELESDSTAARRTVTHVNLDIFLQPDRCPNLASIVFPATSPIPSDHVHPSLRRIGIRGVKAETLYPDRPGDARDHLNAINSDRYPNLELIQTIGFLVEAAGDSLVKDIVIWWAEKFEKYGINFLDGEGVLWAYTEPDVTEGKDEEASSCLKTPVFPSSITSSSLNGTAIEHSDNKMMLP